MERLGGSPKKKGLDRRQLLIGAGAALAAEAAGSSAEAADSRLESLKSELTSALAANRIKGVKTSIESAGLNIVSATPFTVVETRMKKVFTGMRNLGKVNLPQYIWVPERQEPKKADSFLIPAPRFILDRNSTYTVENPGARIISVIFGGTRYDMTF